MVARAFLVHALSPLHAGTGHALDVVDLPTARMKATGIPFLPGSSIKGVLRDVREGNNQNDLDRVLGVFGPDTGSAHEHAGALVVGDARLLALPVRSFRGTFAWTTSPYLLALALRDLNEAEGKNLGIPEILGRGATVTKNSCCKFRQRLYLEDLDLPVGESTKEADSWAEFLAKFIYPLSQDTFTMRFAIVDDETMAFLWETATQVDARVRLDSATRTVATGALWLEESLPPETVLIGLLLADRSRRKRVKMTPADVLDFALKEEETIQLGGKATTGRGRCRLIPVLRQEGAHS